VAITLGFSVAETSLSGALGTINIIEYLGYGIRVWLAILPIHLALFSLQWTVGIYRLQKNMERRWLIWLVIPVMIVLFSFLLIAIMKPNIPFLMVWSLIGKDALFPLPGFCFAIVMLAVLVWVSGTFSLSRAAQETGVAELIKTANQYGFSVYAEKLQTQQRLGISRAASKLPSTTGTGILLWKDILQSRRSFHLSSLFDWIYIFLLMLCFSFLPDFGSRAFVMAIWVIQVGRVSVIRIRSDLSCWSLVRQLPFSYKNLLLFDLCLAYLLSVLTSVTGLALSSILLKTPINTLAILIPGIVAGVAGMTAFDITRHARSNLLLTGSVPAVSVGGILFAFIITAIPVLLNTLLPGLIGLSGSALVSAGLGFCTFSLAVRSYRNIDAS
jgi:hypothetical protein